MCLCGQCLLGRFPSTQRAQKRNGDGVLRVSCVARVRATAHAHIYVVCMVELCSVFVSCHRVACSSCVPVHFFVRPLYLCMISARSWLHGGWRQICPTLDGCPRDVFDVGVVVACFHYNTHPALRIARCQSFTCLTSHERSMELIYYIYCSTNGHTSTWKVNSTTCNKVYTVVVISHARPPKQGRRRHWLHACASAPVLRKCTAHITHARGCCALLHRSRARARLRVPFRRHTEQHKTQTDGTLFIVLFIVGFIVAGVQFHIHMLSKHTNYNEEKKQRRANKIRIRIEFAIA